MSARAPRLPDFEQFYEQVLRLPEGMTGEILEPGVLRTMSRPGRAPRRAAQQCFRSLAGADEASGGSGWWIEQEAELRLDDTLAVPDLSGWRVDRVPELPDDNPIAIRPVWCCEVLSPSTAQVDRGLKLPLYAAAGIELIWLVDPALKLVEVFQSIQMKATLVASVREGEVGRLPPFDLELVLERWWVGPHGQDPR